MPETEGLTEFDRVMDEVGVIDPEDTMVWVWLPEDDPADRILDSEDDVLTVDIYESVEVPALDNVFWLMTLEEATRLDGELCAELEYIKFEDTVADLVYVENVKLDDDGLLVDGITMVVEPEVAVCMPEEGEVVETIIDDDEMN